VDAALKSDSVEGVAEIPRGEHLSLLLLPLYATEEVNRVFGFLS